MSPLDPFHGLTVERARHIELGAQRKIVRRLKHRKLLSSNELQRLEEKHLKPRTRWGGDRPYVPSPTVYGQLGRILQPSLRTDPELVDLTAEPPKALRIKHVDAPARAQRPVARLWSILARIWNWVPGQTTAGPPLPPIRLFSDWRC
jgi:hypothetical protein